MKLIIGQFDNKKNNFAVLQYIIKFNTEFTLNKVEQRKSWSEKIDRISEYRWETIDIKNVSPNKSVTFKKS